MCIGRLLGGRQFRVEVFQTAKTEGVQARQHPRLGKQLVTESTFCELVFSDVILTSTRLCLPNIPSSFTVCSIRALHSQQWQVTLNGLQLSVKE